MHHPPHLQAVWTEIWVTHCFCDWSTFWFKHPPWMWDIWRTAVLSHICICHHVPEADLHFDSRVFLQLLKPHSELFPHRGGLKNKIKPPNALLQVWAEQAMQNRGVSQSRAELKIKLHDLKLFERSLRNALMRVLKLHSGTRVFDSCNWVTWCGLWCWGKLVQH